MVLVRSHKKELKVWKVVKINTPRGIVGNFAGNMEKGGEHWSTG